MLPTMAAGRFVLFSFYILRLWDLFTTDILTCQSRKSTGGTNNVNDGSVLLNVMSLSEHAQYRSAHTGSSKWNAAIIKVFNTTCAFLL